jgi:hypothetical protein
VGGRGGWCRAFWGAKGPGVCFVFEVPKACMTPERVRSGQVVCCTVQLLCWRDMVTLKPVGQCVLCMP